MFYNSEFAFNTANLELKLFLSHENVQYHKRNTSEIVNRSLQVEKRH